jgi:hypothetical protein
MYQQTIRDYPKQPGYLGLSRLYETEGRMRDALEMKRKAAEVRGDSATLASLPPCDQRFARLPAISRTRTVAALANTNWPCERAIGSRRGTSWASTVRSRIRTRLCAGSIPRWQNMIRAFRVCS